MQKARGQAAEAALPQLVSTRFQVLFHSPPGVLFTFPSRYLFTIGRRRILSLGRWSFQLPTGFLVSRRTRVLVPGSPRSFAYGTVTPSGRPSQVVQLKLGLITSRRGRTPVRTRPTTPTAQRARAITYDRFRLVPVRSPLLGKSLLLSFPGGTEMFQFPPFASSGLFDSAGDHAALPARGCPIRRPPGQRMFAPHRGLSQLTTSFIACRRQRHPPSALYNLTT